MSSTGSAPHGLRQLITRVVFLATRFMVGAYRAARRYTPQEYAEDKRAHE